MNFTSAWIQDLYCASKPDLQSFSFFVSRRESSPMCFYYKTNWYFYFKKKRKNQVFRLIRAGISWRDSISSEKKQLVLVQSEHTERPQRHSHTYSTHGSIWRRRKSCNAACEKKKKVFLQLFQRFYRENVSLRRISTIIRNNLERPLRLLTIVCNPNRGRREKCIAENADNRTGFYSCALEVINEKLLLRTFSFTKLLRGLTGRDSTRNGFLSRKRLSICVTRWCMIIAKGNDVATTCCDYNNTVKVNWLIGVCWAKTMQARRGNGEGW